MDPPDLARYYPNTYYSIADDRWPGIRRYAPGFFTSIDRVASRFGAIFAPANLVARFASVAPGASATILDVGCGSGLFLRRLAACGFRNLVGIDPFLDASHTRHGFPLLKTYLTDFDGGPFDVILFNHSLEHVRDPAADLAIAARLLRAGGTIVVRVPVVAYASRRYREHWVQLDAPRHVVLPTIVGMSRLAARARLRLEATHFDSGSFQFWGSRCYRNGDSLAAATSAAPFSGRWFVQKAERVPLAIAAAALNLFREGDQATFVLRAHASA